MKTALKGIKASKSIYSISKLAPVIHKMDAKSIFLLVGWARYCIMGKSTHINLRPEAGGDELDPYQGWMTSRRG